MGKGNNPRKRLSKNVLEMKFMKKTKERTELELENEERQLMFADQIPMVMRDQGLNFTIDSSFASVEDLNFGRMAFLGMNPEIEKMATDERVANEEKKRNGKEESVYDGDMADRLGSVGKKLATVAYHLGAESSVAYPVREGPLAQ